MREPTRAKARQLGVGSADHHVFLCADPTKPRCAPAERSLAVWRHLKARLQEHGLEGKVHEDPALPCVLRTKVDCLRVCREGPVAVVYPEGVWYGRVDEAAVDRIVEEHLLGGRTVQDHVIEQAPLRGRAGSGGPTG